jgi:adenylylsulfate kinase
MKNNNNSFTVWFTGISGSGKTTLANALQAQLKAHNIYSFCIDGDNLRVGLCKDLGFSDSDRKENMRRASCLAKMINDQGHPAIVSLISPFKAERATAKNYIGENKFLEVFVDCSYEECAKRDVKGLYKKAQTGSLHQFTGKDSTYEIPENPSIRINTSEVTIETGLQIIVSEIEARYHLLLS